MWAEERREMTEGKAKRKRAPRSEKPGKEGGPEERKEESSLYGHSLGPGVAYQMLPWWVVVTISEEKAQQKPGREAWRVGDAGRGN